MTGVSRADAIARYRTHVGDSMTLERIWIQQVNNCAILADTDLVEVVQVLQTRLTMLWNLHCMGYCSRLFERSMQGFDDP